MEVYTEIKATVASKCSLEPSCSSIFHVLRDESGASVTVGVGAGHCTQAVVTSVQCYRAWSQQTLLLMPVVLFLLQLWSSYECTSDGTKA